MIAVGTMRLGRRDLAKIGVSGMNAPRIRAHHVPMPQEPSFERDFSDDVEARDGDQQSTLRSWVDVMKVIEDGKRDISRQAKRWKIINNDFCRSAGIKLVVAGGCVFEKDRWQFVCRGILRGLVFDAAARCLGNGIDLDQHRSLAGFPLFKLLKNAASEFSSANVKLACRIAHVRMVWYMLLKCLSLETKW